MSDEMKIDEVLSYLDPDERQAFDRLHGTVFPHEVNLSALMVLTRSLATTRKDVIESARMIEDGSMSHTDCASFILQEAERLERLFELAKEMR